MRSIHYHYRLRVTKLEPRTNMAVAAKSMSKELCLACRSYTTNRLLAMQVNELICRPTQSSQRQSRPTMLLQLWRNSMLALWRCMDKNEPKIALVPSLNFWKGSYALDHSPKIIKQNRLLNNTNNMKHGEITATNTQSAATNTRVPKLLPVLQTLPIAAAATNTAAPLPPPQTLPKSPTLASDESMDRR